MERGLPHVTWASHDRARHPTYRPPGSRQLLHDGPPRERRKPAPRGVQGLRAPARRAVCQRRSAGPPAHRARPRHSPLDPRAAESYVLPNWPRQCDSTDRDGAQRRRVRTPQLQSGLHGGQGMPRRISPRHSGAPSHQHRLRRLRHAGLRVQGWQARRYTVRGSLRV